jgi:predicted DNA-binding transcriptional regulator YafY
MSAPRGQEVIIDYTNWRGQRAARRIIPKRIYFGATEFHKTPQWLLVADCRHKNEERTFAIEDIHMWVPAK